MEYVKKNFTYIIFGIVILGIIILNVTQPPWQFFGLIVLLGAVIYPAVEPLIEKIRTRKYNKGHDPRDLSDGADSLTQGEVTEAPFHGFYSKFPSLDEPNKIVTFKEPAKKDRHRVFPKVKYSFVFGDYTEFVPAIFIVPQSRGVSTAVRVDKGTIFKQQAIGKSLAVPPRSGEEKLIEQKHSEPLPLEC